jgi:hypothetical protein
MGALASTVAWGVAVFVAAFMVGAVLVLAVTLAVGGRSLTSGTTVSPGLVVVFGLVTLVSSLASAYLVGRRLPQPPAGGPIGIMAAAATPVACYVLVSVLTLGGTLDVLATILQVAALLAGAAIGAWFGQRANPHLAD